MDKTPPTKLDTTSGSNEFHLPGATAAKIDPDTFNEISKRKILSTFIVTSCGYFYKTPWHRLEARRLPDEEVYILCLGGRGWFQFADSYHNIHAGDLICCHRDVLHSYGSHPRDPWTIRWAHCSGSASLDWAHELGFSPERQIIHTLRLNDAAEAMQRSLHALLQGHSLHNILIASASLQNSLALLLHAITEKSSGHKQWGRLQAYVASHSAQHIRLSDLAQHCQLSNAHLTRICRQHSGMAPIEYANFIKMQLAAQALLSSDRKIKDVAADSGFDDQYYFSRIFKQSHGRSPRLYRSEHRD